MCKIMRYYAYTASLKLRNVYTIAIRTCLNANDFFLEENCQNYSLLYSVQWKLFILTTWFTCSIHRLPVISSFHARFLWRGGYWFTRKTMWNRAEGSTWGVARRICPGVPPRWIIWSNPMQRVNVLLCRQQRKGHRRNRNTASKSTRLWRLAVHYRKE